MNHSFQWTAPAPLWPEVLPAAGSTIGSFAQPALLRFAADSFMDDFLALLERDPAQTRSLTARPETWRGMPQQPQLEQALQPEGRLASKVRELKQIATARRGLQSKPLVRAGAGSAAAADQTKPIKLYQPAHQRFYLVSASLICQVSGFPDHRPDPGEQERVGFVMRRLLPASKPQPEQDLPTGVDSTWDEYAYVVTPMGPGWRRIKKPGQTAADEPAESPRMLIPGEELLPLFPLAFREEDGRRRHLFAGLVPVGRREAYLGAPKQVVVDASALEPSAGARQGAGPRTARMALFRTQVAEPWKRLIELAFKAAAEAGESFAVEDGDGDESAQQAIKAAREQIQVGSWLILMEFADYLQQYLPQEWERLKSPTPVAGESALLNELRRTVIDDTMAGKLVEGAGYTTAKVKRSLRAALLEAADTVVRGKLEAATGAYDRNNPSTQWPEFLFPLSDPLPTLDESGAPNPGPVLRWKAVADPTNVPDLSPDDQASPEGEEASYHLDEPGVDDLRSYLDSVDKLVALAVRALPVETSQPVPAVPLAAQPLLDHRDGVFVIRCVFDRPRCRPKHDEVVSEATQPFRLANFFDHEAPARPIRIAMPLDTTSAGLRKFNKNTAFMISDVLCGQVQRAKGMTLGDLVRSVLPWPLHKDLSGMDTSPCKSKDPALQLGMMCSLSIPIITICAFILLMIMVGLLDIIFRWIPWFITCFPIPGLKGKNNA